MLWISLHGEHKRKQQQPILENSLQHVLLQIHVWHDNTGVHPDWYLSRVIIRDLQTDKKWYFLANCWLSLAVEGEGATVEKDLFRACESEFVC